MNRWVIFGISFILTYQVVISDPATYDNFSLDELITEVKMANDPQSENSTSASDIGRTLIRRKKVALFKSGLDDPFVFPSFQIVVDELEDSDLKDDLKLHMLKNDRHFLDFSNPRGNFPLEGRQAEHYLYLFEKYLPGIGVDPRDFDYPTRRKILVERLEAAMAEKRKPRESRRPDASDFEGRSGSHVGKGNAAEPTSADTPDFFTPVPIGIAAGVAALLALLGLIKLKGLRG